MKCGPSLKTRALRYLSIREYSKKALSEKLFRFAQDDDNLDELLTWLEEQGYLSNCRFAESLATRKMARYGNNRIVHELRRHDADGDLDHAMMEMLIENEASRAFAIWHKKFGTWPKEAKEQAKQMRFLQQRGFSSSAIKAVISLAKDPENSHC